MNKRGQLDFLHVTVGILLIGGGIAYLLNQSLLGGLIASMALVIELAVNFAKSLT